LSGSGPASTDVPVVAAVITRAGRYLVGQRPGHKRHGGLWEFPGGKVLEGESHLDATRRELAEELGLDVVALGALLYSARDPGSRYRIDFVEVETHGEPSALEHARVAWHDPAELRALALAPADAAFVRWLTSARGLG